MDFKSWILRVINTNAVINHAEMGMKKEKTMRDKKAANKNLPTKKADEKLKKYKNNFMI